MALFACTAALPVLLMTSAVPVLGAQGSSPRTRTKMDTDWPVQSKIHVPLFAARTLNDTGQSRVTLSLR